MGESKQALSLVELLVKDGLCGSDEEGLIYVTQFMEEEQLAAQPDDLISILDSEEATHRFLREFLGVDDMSLTTRIYSQWISRMDGNRDDGSSVDSGEPDPNDRISFEEMNDGDDDGEYIGEGECELCERFIQITKHHLIPKSQWSKVQVRLQNARQALEANDMDRAQLILGNGLAHFVQAHQARVPIRRFLNQTCNVCRPCHSAIHKTHENSVLAFEFNLLEKLEADPGITRFAKWASKQKAGKYSRPDSQRSRKRL